VEIVILKKGGRNQLVCQRDDGSREISELGPNLPLHDLAHFIVERQLGLKKGFYGNINNGFTVKQLSNKDVIKTLHTENAIAEVTTRTLQSLSNGACRQDQFVDLIDLELEPYGMKSAVNLSTAEIEGMLKAYQDLLSKWEQLSDGESLSVTLQFETVSPL